MVRSGLQQDVINLYRQGVRNAMSKPAEAREAFMLHWRYSFRHPALKKRDYAAIEHQIRRLSRTLEMLESPSVNRISVSQDMRDWWASTIAPPASSTSSTSSILSSPSPSSNAARASSGSRTLYTSSSSSAASPFVHTYTSTPIPSAAFASAAASHSSSVRLYSSSTQSAAGGSGKGAEGNDAPATAQIGETALEKGETKGRSEQNPTIEEGGKEPTKKGGKSGKDGKGERGEQWGGKLPGHGGT